MTITKAMIYAQLEAAKNKETSARELVDVWCKLWDVQRQHGVPLTTEREKVLFAAAHMVGWQKLEAIMDEEQRKYWEANP